MPRFYEQTATKSVNEDPSEGHFQMLTRHSQTIVLLAGLVAAIIGIFFAKQEPYSGIAAGAVAIACAIGIRQAYRQAKDAQHSKEMLRNLVRSLPSNQSTVDKMRELVISNAKTHGFVWQQFVSTRSDPYDPEASTICVFRSPNNESSTPTGILVISPASYSELSTLPERQVAPAIEQLVYGTLPSDLSKQTIDSLTNSLLGLNDLARYYESGGVRVQRRMSDDGKAMTIKAGDIEVTFAGNELNRLCTMPTILRDLSIAKTVQEQRPSLATFIAGLGG